MIILGVGTTGAGLTCTAVRDGSDWSLVYKVFFDAYTIITTVNLFLGSWCVGTC